MTAVTPCYQPAAGTPLTVDRRRYGRIGSETGARTRVHEHVIPPRSGYAWKVPAGHVCRVTTIEGPQVGDLCLWSAANPRERFWASRTRQLHRAHVTTFDRLWSTLPYLRPLATIVADSIAYGVDDDGARCHDLLGTRCDPYVNTLLTGERYDFHCHSNLVRAVLPHGLAEDDVHDVINLFQVTGLTRDGDQYFVKPCPARAGDHIELFAEIDLLLALSTCPGGDLSVPIWGPDAGPSPCRPLAVEVFRLDDGLLEGWTAPPIAGYAGLHGMTVPGGDPAAGR